MFNPSALKSGDPVCFYIRDRRQYDNVDRVTATQIVLNGGRKFSIKTGNEIKSEKIQFPSASLADYETAKKRDEIEAAQKAQDAKLAEVVQLLTSRKNYYGNFCRMTPEIVAAAEALSALLKAPTAE